MAELRITAGLNAELSATEIEKDLSEKVEPKLQAKAPNVKIVAGLKPTETATQIQSDLNKLIGQTKAPTIKVGIDVGNQNAVQSISAGLKDVQAQAQQTANAVREVSTVNISDKMITQIIKEFKVASNTSDEFKAKLKSLLTEMSTGWNNYNEEAFNKALNETIKLLGDNQIKYKELQKSTVEYDNALFELSELQLAINKSPGLKEKFYIPPDFKTELQSAVGNVNQFLNHTYGIGNWTYNAKKQLSGYKNIVDILDNEAYEMWSRSQKSGNAFSTFLVETSRKIDTLKAKLNSKDTMFSQMFSTEDPQKAIAYIEKVIAEIIKLKDYTKRSNDPYAWFEELTTDADTAKISIDNLGNSVQKVQNTITGAKSKGNYFYNNEEILKSIRIFNQEENAIGTLEAKFKELGATVSTVERANGSGFLTGFTVNVKSATGEIEKFKYAWKNLGTEEQPNYKYALDNITAANAGIQKLQQSLDKVFSDYTQKLEQFKSTNHGLLSGLSEPIKNFESKLAGLKNGTATIDEVKNSFQALNAEAAKITANFSRQLSPTDAAIRNISKSEDTIRNLRMEITGLNTAPKEINTELEKCVNLLANVKRIEAEQGTTEKWSKAYKDWELSVESLTSKIKTLKSYEESISTSISSLNTLQNSAVFKNNASNPEVVKAKADIKALITDYQNLKTQLQGTVTPEGLKQIEATLTSLNSRFKTATEGAASLQRSLADTNGVDKLRQKTDVLIARIEAYKQANSNAVKTFGGQFESMLSQLRSGNLDNAGVDRISKQFQILRQEINATGKAGKTFFQSMIADITKFAKWMSMTYFISTFTRSIRSMVTSVVELDTAIVDLKKTFTGTETDLENFYISANQTAKDLGVTTKEIIEQAAAWSRLGYSSAETAELMAKNSAIFKTISPGMDMNTATDGLVSMMKAFDIEANNVLDGIMSKVNIVGRFCRL